MFNEIFSFIKFLAGVITAQIHVTAPTEIEVITDVVLSHYAE